MVEHNDAVTEKREEEARKHLAEARALLEGKADDGKFDWRLSAAGQLILALETLLGVEHE